MDVCAHASEVKTSSVRTTLEWALKIYDSEVKTVNQIVKEHNLKLLDACYQEEADGGEVDWNAVCAKAWKYVPDYVATETDDAMMKYLSKFRQRWGLSRCASRKQGAHLPYNDLAMEDYRNYINTASGSQGVHERLIAYWDQIWCLAFTPEPNVMWKDPSPC